MEILLIYDYVFINWQHANSSLVRSLMKNLHVAKVLETCITFLYGIKVLHLVVNFVIVNTTGWIIIKFCEHCNEPLSFVKSDHLCSLSDYQFIKMRTGFMALIRKIKIFVAGQNYTRIRSPKCTIIKPNQNKVLSLLQLHHKATFLCVSAERKQANSETKFESELWTLFWYFILISIWKTCGW